MSKVDFSIIIPVYNGEKHLEKCLDRLLKQTYNNYEIIVINDGSLDNTYKIAKEYTYKDNRIKVLNQDNQGVSRARNYGIEQAKGEYILFVDSDDSLKIDALEKLKKIVENKMDLVLFGFSVLGDTNRPNDTKILNELANEKTNIKKIEKALIATKDNILGYIWRAVYSKDLLTYNNIKFPEGIKISEDYMFLLYAIHMSKKIQIYPDELYEYQIGESSMSTKYIPTLLSDMSYVNDWMFYKIVQKNPDLEVGYNCCVCNTYLRYVQNSFRDNENSFWEISKNVIRNKHQKNFQKSLNKVWNKKRLFDLKSYIGIILFRFHFDYIYFVLFYIKERL